MHNCERVPDASVAVPRNRVYARYVTVCANEKIKPLNPASFGKLVRLLYPEIKTRRLGVRGQSKYHYCGIRLAGEHTSPNTSLGPGSASGSEPPAHAVGEDHVQVFIPLRPLYSSVADWRALVPVIASLLPLVPSDPLQNHHPNHHPTNLHCQILCYMIFALCDMTIQRLPKMLSEFQTSLHLFLPAPIPMWPRL
jgi:hypothetical protein